MAIIKAILNRDKSPDKKTDSKATGKKKTNWLCPIYIRLHHKHRRKYVSIGRSVKENDWDEETGFVKKTNSNYATINAIIRSTIKNLEEEVLMVLATEKTDDVVSSIHKKEKKRSLNNFFLVAEKYFAELEKSSKYSRLDGEKPRVNHVRAFHRSGMLRFEEIDPAFLRKFQIYLKNEYECSERTIMNHLVVIRTLYNYAIQEGVADKNLYPFGKGKVVIRFPESQKIGLNEHEVRMIEEADFSSDLYLDWARDVWLFSFYLAGIRISDVFRLQWKDCIDQRLNYKMGKNNKVVSLKLPEKANAILDKYRPAEPDHEVYVFGILSKDDELNSRNTFTKIRTGAHKVNNSFRTIAKRLKINKKISCHISRHTFGNITGDKISPQMLQKLYRHTDIKTTMGYQSNFIHQDVDDALESVLNF